MKKNIIICPKCDSTVIKKELKEKEVAFCPVCNKKLYESEKYIKFKILNFSLAALIFFLIAMFLPVIHINIAGYEENLQILNSFIFLFSKDYIVLSLFIFFSVIMFPFICMMIIFVLSLMFIGGIGKKTAKNLLIPVTVLKDWCFTDIFLIAVFVSVIKLLNVAEVNFNVGLIAYVLFLGFLIYIIKFLKVESLWEIWENM